MLPEYPKFRSLEFPDLELIAGQLKKAPQQICEFSLANLLIWKDFDKPRLTAINQNLCIQITPPNEPPFFLQPLGSNQLLETVAVCLQQSGKISRASENFISLLPHQQFKMTCLRSQFDYIYERKTLAELKGRKYDGKRNHLKNFRRRHPDYEFLPLSDEHQQGCLDLFADWFSARKESRYFPRLAYTSQKGALEETFKYYQQLPFSGGALLIDKQIKGFIIGSPLNKETVSVHFQYGHPALRGIFQTLLWEACNKSFTSFNYVNLEQDLGIPGLRKAKLSYNPLRLEKKYEIAASQK